MSLRGKLELYGLTDVGLRRGHNEDSIRHDLSMGLAVLADGMGGYKAGEVASDMAVSVIMEEVRRELNDARPEQEDGESSYARGSLMLREAIRKGNEAIYDAARDRAECQGMGTTLVAALFYDNRVSIAHVGDSRVYRLRHGAFEQLTVDHSLIQELVDKGFYTPEEAAKSVQRNLVTRAMGVDPTVREDLQEQPVLPGDLYLLCSDGLSDLVADQDIHLTLAEHSANLAQAADILVQMANRKGGTDNISVLLAKALRPFPARSGHSWYSRVIHWFS